MPCHTCAMPATAALMALLVLLATSPAGAVEAASPAAFSLEEVTGYPFPNELAAAASANRIAWAFNERGIRNVWVAEGPEWKARRVTGYDRDDGQELTSVSLSGDGRWVVYVRGGEHGAIWDEGLPVHPFGTSAPTPVQVWSVPFGGGEPKAIADGDDPAVSPRGDVVAFVKDRQVWSVAIDGSAPPRRLVTARGGSGQLRWSPDGSRLAFVSSREDHAFVGVFTDDATPVTWMAPSTSRDSSPRWSPDGTRLAFVRRPGRGGPPAPLLEQRHQAWEIWTAEVATGAGRLLWKAPGTLRGSYPTTHGNANLHWTASRRIVFVSYADGWPHLYSIPEAGGEPLLLTPGAFMVEHVSLAPDLASLVFAANTGLSAGDVDRRHVARVAADRAGVEVLTPGTGLEWSPVVTGDGRHVAFLAAGPRQPPLPMVRPLAGGKPRTVGADRLSPTFPAGRLVDPRPVTIRSGDGLTIHAQLFEGAGDEARKPAIVYVHGGPPRQMLLGWHYSSYYSNAYAVNQYLASRGFVVLSVNYRLGIGYGFEFHHPPAAGNVGASEYLDVKAAAEYLRGLPGVDPARIGIWGGSYGGFLTALALGRNSDLFAAGVDLHGVHDFTTSRSGIAAALRTSAATGQGRFEPGDLERALPIAWTSSPVSWVGSWTSPVLLIHGDDDRNVSFGQTVDLARRLAAKGVPHEELVVVDDTHHFLHHENQLRVDAAVADFFERHLRRGRGAGAGK